MIQATLPKPRKQTRHCTCGTAGLQHAAVVSRLGRHAHAAYAAPQMAMMCVLCAPVVPLVYMMLLFQELLLLLFTCQRHVQLQRLAA